jgi:hypothetical protein
MKKIFIFLFILLSVVIYYFYNKKNPKKNYYEIQSSNNMPAVFKPVHSEDVKPLSNKTIKTQDTNFEKFDQVEKEWLIRIEKLLGRSNFEYYSDLRSKNEEEKMKAYKEFHEYLRLKHGDNFSYNISEDQSVREKEVNTKYTRLLLTKIGEEKFKEYLIIRDHFNEEQQRKDQDGNALVIEF